MTSRQSHELVLHVTEASLGGLRRHVADLMQGLHALGVRQVLAYSSARADSGMRLLVAWCDSVGIPTIELEMHRRVAPVSDLRAVVALRAQIRRLAPTVLHLHSSKAGGVGRLAALGVPLLRVVYTPNGLATHLSRAFEFLERILGHLRTDSLIAVSTTEYNEIASMRIVPASRLIRIDAGISAEETVALAGSPPAPAHPTVVLVGRLTAQKDPLFAAEVSARVIRRLPQARFVWVGDGELRPDFEARIRALGVEDRWTITGWVENPFGFVAAGTVCALVSRYEGVGYVNLEAMALGKPMIATRVAGSGDLVVDGVTGLLLPLDDLEGFASATARLLADEATCRAMGKAAQERVALFSRDRMAQETLELYATLAGGARRS